MEVATGVAAGTVGIGALLFSRYGKWRVNCWFCNENSWVAVSLRNSFICPKCEQYNGFNEDGDYAEPIKEQHRIAGSPTRFACPGSTRPPYDGGTRREGIDSNGLCSTCNDKMKLMTLAVANFEARNEDNWQDELADYRYRLEKIYPLCERCVLASQRQLQAQRTAFSYLRSLPSRILPSKERATSLGRPRRNFFSGGPLTSRLHLISFALSLLLCLSHLHNLLLETDLLTLSLPSWFHWLLEVCLSHCLPLSSLLFVSHVVSLFTNRARLSLPDLLTPPVSLLLLFSLFFPPSPDLLLLRTAASSFLFILLSAVALLPRKLKHRKRANHILASAFSVASTPLSQCSSQDQSARLLSPSSPLQAEPRFHLWRETVKEQTPMPARESTPAAFASPITPKDMDWEPSFVNGPSTASASILSFRRRQAAGREKEATSSLELSSRISGISLDRHLLPSVGTRQGPFSSLSIHSAAMASPSMASPSMGSPFIASLRPSLFDRRDVFSARQPPSIRRFGAPSERAPSHLTSASQLEQSRGLFPLLILIAVTSSASLIGVLILFYLNFRSS